MLYDAYSPLSYDIPILYNFTYFLRNLTAQVSVPHSCQDARKRCRQLQELQDISSMYSVDIIVKV